MLLLLSVLCSRLLTSAVQLWGSFLENEGWILFAHSFCNFYWVRFIICPYVFKWVGITQSGWAVWGSNPGGGDVFRTHPDRPWGPPNFLCNGYRVSFPGVKRPGCSVNYQPPYSAEIEGRVELYLCFSCGPKWPVLGWTVLLTLPFLVFVVIWAYGGSLFYLRQWSSGLNLRWFCLLFATVKWWFEREVTVTISRDEWWLPGDCVMEFFAKHKRIVACHTVCI